MKLLLRIHEELPDAALRACLALTSNYFHAPFHVKAFAALQLPTDISNDQVRTLYSSSGASAGIKPLPYHTFRRKFLRRLGRDEWLKAPEERVTLCTSCFCFPPPQFRGQPEQSPITVHNKTGHHVRKEIV